MSSWDAFIDQVGQSTLWEWAAVLTGVLYVIFAANNQRICWLFALISSGLYIYICIDFQLYIESSLQLFYFVMAIVGWISWNRMQATGDKIVQWKLSAHAVNILLSGVAAFILGYFFDRYTDQANPYVDAFTTCYSLTATFMVARRVLENWIYWIIIDLVSIYLYAGRGLLLSSVLYALFTVLAVVGFVLWMKKFKRQTT